jgi:hypothetical protein
LTPFALACLAYLSTALPGSTLGLLWPRMQSSFHQPVSALGLVVVVSVVSNLISSAATGRALSRWRTGALAAWGTFLVAAALGAEAWAASLWAFVVAAAVFGVGFGALDSAVNAYSAAHFGPRQATWMHASYGLGATVAPLVVIAELAAGAGWRVTYASFAVVIGVVAAVLVAGRHKWEAPPAATGRDAPGGPPGRGVAGATLAFSAVEAGVESGAGVWGYIFLAQGRHLAPSAAGAVVAAYWAMMFLGRVVLGPVAQRAGTRPVMTWAVAGVAAGAALMAAPGPALAIVGMMALGLAAAPIFPLLTLMDLGARPAAGHRGRAGQEGLSRQGHPAMFVSLQVAASAAGAAGVPSALGIAISSLGATALAPLLLALASVMAAMYLVVLRPLDGAPARAAT